MPKVSGHSKALAKERESRNRGCAIVGGTWLVVVLLNVYALEPLSERLGLSPVVGLTLRFLLVVAGVWVAAEVWKRTR